MLNFSEVEQSNTYANDHIGGGGSDASRSQALADLIKLVRTVTHHPNGRK